MEDNFSTDRGWGGVGYDGSGDNASNAEWQMKLRRLARHLTPAVRPGSKQAADQYRSVARGLGSPALKKTIVAQGA